MKRNMDLIRLVLLKIEAKETSAALYASDLQMKSPPLCGALLL